MNAGIDRVTLAACQRGDTHAFRQLVLAFQQSVLSLCTAMAGPDGEDIAQETFVRVHRAIARFDPDGPASVRTWILVIARRLCHDRARHAGYEATVRVASLATFAVTDPRHDFERARLVRDVTNAIARLPIEHRTVIALREWEGLEYEEIALIEGIPIGTVRSRLARARQALRRMLGTDPVEEDYHAAP